MERDVLKTANLSQEERDAEGKSQSAEPQSSKSKQREQVPNEGETSHKERGRLGGQAPEDGRSSSSQGLVLFVSVFALLSRPHDTTAGHSALTAVQMPYLHWELQTKQWELKRIMEMPKTERETNRHRILEDHPLNEEKGTQKLYTVYLDEEHPLHVRRTLDQYYYHTLMDTEERDKDQTGIRYHDKHVKPSNPNLEPVLTMVDQLWMWVLPACGKLPPTIITAFPQRSDRLRMWGCKNMTVLVDNIINRFRETSERSVDALAQMIAAECSRIYFDTASNRAVPLQFSEIYTTSIGEIVSIPASPIMSPFA